MTSPGGAVGYEVDDGTPPTIRVIPSAPAPEISANGVPTAMLYISGNTGLLTIGVRWWPSDEELTGIRNRVAAALGRSPAEFLVTPDDFRVEGVSLVLADDSGTAGPELARNASSGLPPFTALFSVDVSEHLDAVRRACEGEPDLLSVRVDAELLRGRSVTTVLAAQVGDWAEDLLASDDAAVVPSVEALVQRGVVQRARSSAPDASEMLPDLVAEADRMAAERLVAGVRTVGAQVGGPPGEGTASVGVAATARRPEQLPLVRSADVGAWLRASPGRHVLDAGGGRVSGRGEQAAGSAATERTVRVDLTGEGGPIASVELSGGGEPVILVPPAPTEVKVVAGGDLEVSTRYVDGGEPYRVRLAPQGDGFTVSPADLGLTSVSVDATRLHEAGATAVEADVFYQPEDRGSPDRRTVRFEGDTWRADWFVVSRGPELAGQLVLGLTISPAGTGGVPSRMEFDTASVRL